MKTELIESGLLYPQSKYPRSEGLHLSTILKRMAQENGVLKKERAEEFGLIEVAGDEWWATLPTDVQLKIAMGLAWEEWYIPQLEEVLDHPGEKCVQGIYMTPDAESLDTIVTFGEELLVLCLHEVKLTYKSMGTVGNLSTQWLWLAQTKAYCKAMGTNVAYLHILFVCGDYSWPQRPQLQVWRITYTDLELDVNWEMIVGFARHYLNLEAEEMMRDTYDSQDP